MQAQAPANNNTVKRIENDKRKREAIWETEKHAKISVFHRYPGGSVILTDRIYAYMYDM